MGGNVLHNYSLQVDMTVCDHFHELKLFLPEEIYFELAASPEERYLRKFADCSDMELRCIAENSYQPEARWAAVKLLEQRRNQE